MQRLSTAWTITTILGLAVVALASAQAARDVVIAVPPEIRVAEGFDPAESAGLFVGIRNFDDDQFAEVPFAVDDAVDLAHLFAVELELMPSAKVVLSLAGEPQKVSSRAKLEKLLAAGARREEARQSDVYGLLDRQIRRSGPRGLFVAAFATHGFSRSGDNFLVASHSLRRFIGDTGVRLNRVFDVVAEADAPRRLVLVDACRERFTAQRGEEGSAMSASIADAIAAAEGQAVLFGTTQGGFAYDDFERRNGVFTSAVLDGLAGAAPANDRGLVTVEKLADYVNGRVLEWVGENRPDHRQLSRGISAHLEGRASKMPLAADSLFLRRDAEYRERRRAALARLRQNLGGPLTGALYDAMASFLKPNVPSKERLDLLQEIERLDGSTPLKRSLVFYWTESHGGRSATSPVSVRAPVPPERGPWKDPILGIDFVYAPPGDFWMGSPASEDGRQDDERRHHVTLTRGFWIATTEVTQGQFAEFVKDSGYETEAEKDGGSWVWNGKEWEKKEGITWRDSGGEDHPVAHVSWNDAKAFCRWLSRRTGEEIRLPTEAEWEYAARAGSTEATYAGDLTIKSNCDAPELDGIAWYCGNAEGSSHPVAGKTANAWGLYDMLGNVWEWTEDAADWDSEKKQVVTETYADNQTDPLSTKGSGRVNRGGSWISYARYCRAAFRHWDSPGYRFDFLGFRLVRTLP